MLVPRASRPNLTRRRLNHSAQAVQVPPSLMLGSSRKRDRGDQQDRLSPAVPEGRPRPHRHRRPPHQPQPIRNQEAL